MSSEQDEYFYSKKLVELKQISLTLTNDDWKYEDGLKSSYDDLISPVDYFFD